MLERYKSAEEFLPWNFFRKIRNATVRPYWIHDERFVYKHKTISGHEYILVDCYKSKRIKAFDHERLALMIKANFGRDVNPGALPISNFRRGKNGVVLFSVESVDCDVEASFGKDGELRDIKPSKSVGGSSFCEATLSPCENWYVGLEDGNLKLIPTLNNNAKEKRLTSDGTLEDGYGNHRFYEDFLVAQNFPPVVHWSSDSRYLAVQRIDTRGIDDISIHQFDPIDGTTIPKSYDYKFSGPGARSIPLSVTYVIDIKTGSVIASQSEPVPLLQCLEQETLFWGEGPTLYQLEFSRGRKRVRLVSISPADGEVTILIEESASSFVFPGPQIHAACAVIELLLDTSELIWYSHSEGWGHLYLYDTDSRKLKNKITKLEAPVLWIHFVDKSKREIYFSAGRHGDTKNPYHQGLYRVGFDGSNLILLTQEPGSHEVPNPLSPYYRDLVSVEPDLSGFSPSGNYFLDIAGAVDQPSRAIVRRVRDGSVKFEVCASETSQDVRQPLQFSVKARDESTDLWGVIYKPENFTEKGSYPVVLSIYGGPQFSFGPKFYGEAFNYMGGSHWALAELGFVVVVMDPRGTPLRSKSFQDVIFGNLDNGGGIDDQVHALRQLAKRYIWMDMERVGITGMSGGGYASARAMMTYPDFFKVAVSASGNHDQRLFQYAWAETFHGVMDKPLYDRLSNSLLVDNLIGKLFLIHGAMDAIVHPANTVQLAEALTKAGKDFDFLLLANKDHDLLGDRYLIVKTWNYLVENLMGEVPPKNYVLDDGSEIDNVGGR